MSLFKILKGNEANLPTKKTEGWAYFTKDNGNFYVDISDTERVQLNAKHATFDIEEKGKAEPLAIHEKYLQLAGGVMTGNITFLNDKGVWKSQGNKGFSAILGWKDTLNLDGLAPSVGRNIDFENDGAKGAIWILPYTSTVDPYFGAAGFMIGKNMLRIDGKYVPYLTDENSKNNFIPKFDGIKGNLKTSGISIDNNENLVISHAATPDMNPASTNPQIIFAENGSQPVHLMYTDYDSYRSPAGLKILGGSSANPAWFEVQGTIYSNGYKIISTSQETLFEVDKDSNTFINGNLGLGGKNSSYKLYVKGTSYFDGMINASGGIKLDDSTPEAVPSYILGIKPFAEGGQVIWEKISSIKVGTADKLSVSGGSSSQPVYFQNGIPAGIDFHISNKIIGPVDANNAISNGLYYYNAHGPYQLGETHPDGGLYVQGYDNNFAGQIAQDYRNGNLFIRGKNNGSWTKWKAIPDRQEVTDKINDIQIGGRNLILDTEFHYGCQDRTYWAVNRGKGEVISKGEMKISYNGNSSAPCLFNIKSFNFIVNQEYTLSFQVKLEGTNHQNAIYVMVDGGGSGFSTSFSSIGDKYQYITKTFKLSSITNPKNVQFNFYPTLKNNNNSDVFLYIKNIKVEKGNKATDWTPAPEDMLIYTDGTKLINKNEYWGLSLSDGTDTQYLRTPQPGILPYEAGSNGTIGISSWRFKDGYIDNLHGTADKTLETIFVSNASSNEFRPVWFSYSGAANRGKLVHNDKFQYNPSTDILKVGNIDGNAKSATSLSLGTSLDENNCIPEVGKAQIFQVNANCTAGGHDGAILTTTWTSGQYATQLYLDADPTKIMSIRHRRSDGSWTTWSRFLHSDNFNDYAVKKVTATDNAIARFDGTAGNIQNSGITIDDTNALYTPGRIGIGKDDAGYKFYVQGASYFEGNTINNGKVYFGSGGMTYYIDNNSQGKLLSLALGGLDPSSRYKLYVDGESWIKGQVWTKNLDPDSTNAHRLGSENYVWNSSYIKTLNITGHAYIKEDLHMQQGGSRIVWDQGTYQQCIKVIDDSTKETPVFNFQQSENGGASWSNLLTIKDDATLVMKDKVSLHYNDEAESLEIIFI